MSETIDSRAGRVFIVAEAGSVRQLMSDVVRGLGFVDVTVLGSGVDTLSQLEVDTCDWLLMPMLGTGEVNALQILRLIGETPRLRGIRTSLFYEPEEEGLLDTAFKLGLMSAHAKSFQRDDLLGELKALLGVVKAFGARTPLVAAAYLRRHLVKHGKLAALLTLERNLLRLFPGSVDLLLKLGEAQILNGRQKEGVVTLQQATIIDEGMKEAAEAVSLRLLNMKVSVREKGVEVANVLDLRTCVLIDPDSSVLTGVKGLLHSAGVPRVEVFDDGQAAWEWLAANEEPDLILQEWRLPTLSGPMLLQRVRQHGFHRTLVNVVSSIIKPKEVHLLREMGVDDVIAKPFGPQAFFKSIIWTVQQNVAPTERAAVERKIARHLRAGEVAEAERLAAAFASDARNPTAAKRLVQAELAFHQGRFREARDLGIESLKLSGDTLQLLNLIGKSLIKLGDHAAALRFFEKAHTLSPFNIEHLCNLAISQYDAGNGEAATAAIAEAKAIDAGNEQLRRTECQLAIIAGETTKAKELMASLSTVDRIVGYMNNRAVALSRSGRYDEGIRLYHDTAQSLPGTWGEIHDVVAYNLGLAYARYGELKEAGEALGKVAKRQGAPLAKRAKSLLVRIKQAADTGTALALAESAVDAAESEDDGASVAQALEAVLTTARGDLCLSGVFEPDGAEPAAAAQLLKNQPRFSERATLRTESLSRRVATR